jgi:hypothetical protein
MYTDAVTRTRIVKSIHEKAQSDSDYRERCFNDPEGVLTEAAQEFLGADFSFPEGTQFETKSEPLNKVYLVIPEAPASAGELSLDELESAAGGRGRPAPIGGDDVEGGNNNNTNRRCSPF